ncbi:MAG: hypothetical protein H6603_05130 [Flavobacteriales bacterium]|nr:hypothetical protein [Flavobacteriales bacterium]MCB9204344.1 hypothetical protein [Flavobacteriales bacterium]
MSEKGNRTVALAALLSSKEMKVFSSHLNEGKRASLPLLFDAICVGLKSSKPNSLEKETLFKKAFNEAYSKDQDYLLRNEFRLLSKELTGFLAIEQTKKAMRDDVLEEKRLVLQSYIDRKAHDLFDREWQKVVEDSKDELRLDVAIDIQKLAIEHLVSTRQATVENYNQLLELLADHQQTLQQHFAHQHLFGKHKQAFAERTLQAIGSDIQVSPLEVISINPADEKQNDAFANHFAALTKAYAHRGEEKIELLKNAAGFVSEINSKSFDRNAALATVNAAIALEYFLLRELEASLPFHQKALEFGSGLEGGKLISFVFNYLSTLIRLERHEQAIALINEYASVWEKLPRMRDRFLCLKAMCHVFENDPKAAEDCIPDDRKAGGLDHYYYYRFIQIIVLFQKGKPELAMNEAENFEHTVRYNDKDEDYLRLIQAMKKLLMLNSEKPTISEEVYSDKAEKLKQSLSEASESAFADRALLYRWIVAELN